MREGQKELEEERTGERDRGSLHNYFFSPSQSKASVVNSGVEPDGETD